ncbi:MAG: hypothetical protein ACXVZV_05080 [Terriglobales bacterium]
MSDVPNKTAEILKCPLCEGRGELEKDILLERLQEKDLARKVQSYLSNIVEAECKEELHGVPPSEVAKHSTDSWNLTHFLWRRSPKE